MPVYFYDPPERFVAGAVGQPGERIFYLQATSSGRVTSVVLEKFQVSLLAERIDELLDEVLRRTGGSPEVPATAPASLQDDAPLDLPLLEDFRVGAIALAWDGDGGMVVIEAQEESDEPVEPLAEDLPADGPGVLRVRITPGAARAFAERAAKIVSAAAAVPAVRTAAGHRGAHLPAAERSPRQPCLSRNGPRPTMRTASRPLSTCSRAGRWRSRDGWWTRPTRRCTARSAPMAGRAGGLGGREPPGAGGVWGGSSPGPHRLRLQADRGGAAAVGLPDGHAGRAGGRGLCGVARRRLGRGPADGHARRAVRPGHVPAVDRPLTPTWT